MIYAAFLLSGCGLTIGFVLLYSRLTYWRDSYYAIENQCSEALSRAISAEGERAKIESEMNFQKKTLTLLASRESLAVLTDNQIQHIISSIVQLIVAQQKTPNQLN